jgi:hypothetical protein
MQPDTYSDMTWFFKVAQDHYLREPGRQIGLEFWSQAADYPEPWQIHVGLYCIENASLSTIPVLAAVSLDFSATELLNVIKHHGMSAAEFFNLKCTKNLKGSQPEDRIALSSWTIHTKIVDAMSLDPSLTQSILKETKANFVGTFTDRLEIEMARLLSDSEELWPITGVNRYIASKNNVESDYDDTAPPITDLNTFNYCGPEFSDLSNAQVLLMLERSGNLSMAVTNDNGFRDQQTKGFFRDLFVSVAISEYPNLRRIVDAINSVDDPDQLLELNSRLISVLSDLDYIEGQGKDTFTAMQNLLDKNRYSPFFDSPLIRLNLDVPLDTPNQTDVARLFNLLRTLETSEFGNMHFNAIYKSVKGDRTIDDFRGADLHEFLVVALNGLTGAFSIDHKRHYDLVVEAEASVEHLIRFVFKNTEIDYKRLQTLSSGSKSMLVSNGLDIKKLPGINNRDKGALISDQLGL